MCRVVTDDVPTPGAGATPVADRGLKGVIWVRPGVKPAENPTEAATRTGDWSGDSSDYKVNLADTKVLSGKAIANLQKLVRTVPVGDFVIDYVTRVVRATRPKDPTAPDFIRKMVDYGAGPRAGQFLIRGGQAMAALDGRFSVAVDDVRKIAVPVLRHRVNTNFQAQAEGKSSDDIEHLNDYGFGAFHPPPNPFANQGFA